MESTKTKHTESWPNTWKSGKKEKGEKERERGERETERRERETTTTNTNERRYPAKPAFVGGAAPGMKTTKYFWYKNIQMHLPLSKYCARNILQKN